MPLLAGPFLHVKLGECIAIADRQLGRYTVAIPVGLTLHTHMPQSQSTSYDSASKVFIVLMIALGL